MRVVVQQIFQRLMVSDIGMVKGTPKGEFNPPGDQRIENNGDMPGILQGRTDGAANVTGTAGNEDLHEFSLCLNLVRFQL
jgi:hypothetical protein